MSIALNEDITISSLKKAEIPGVYILKARGKGRLRVELDLPMKLQELLHFRSGDKLNITISKEEIEDVVDDDLYMRGVVLVKDREATIISIGGLMLRVKGKVDGKLDENDEVFVRVRRSN